MKFVEQEKYPFIFLDSDLKMQILLSRFQKEYKYIGVKFVNAKLSVHEKMRLFESRRFKHLLKKPMKTTLDFLTIKFQITRFVRSLVRKR